MKIVCALTVAALFLCGTQVLAAETGDMRRADPDSALIDEHAPDYAQYLSQYYARYHSMDGQKVPELKDFSSELDPHGRPKWFDGPHGEYTLTMLIVRLFVNEQFDDLEKLVADWNNPDNRMADGRWKLTWLSRGMEQRFDVKAWDNDYQIIQRWRMKYPRSAAAAITEAEYWRSYAVDARGQGYADSVSQEGWKLFGQRLKKAEKVLFESQGYASSNPEWYASYIRIAHLLQWPKADILKLNDEGSRIQKSYYDIYFATLVPLTPIWGGDWKMVDDFITETVKKTNAAEGDSLYARLYWAANRFGGSQKFNIFRDTYASWPRMKKSFEDIAKQYPHSAWILNNFASFACQAGDKATFQSVRFRIGNNVTPEAWRSNYSLDLCEHQFPDQPL